MAKWTKDSDLLPLKNAQAQVKFYTQDLVYAEKYLAYVKTMAKYKLPGYAKILSIAEKDVEVSKKNLEKSKLKLEESKGLE